MLYYPKEKNLRNEKQSILYKCNFFDVRINGQKEAMYELSTYTLNTLLS